MLPEPVPAYTVAVPALKSILMPVPAAVPVPLPMMRTLSVARTVAPPLRLPVTRIPSPWLRTLFTVVVMTLLPEPVPWALIPAVCVGEPDTEPATIESAEMAKRTTLVSSCLKSMPDAPPLTSASVSETRVPPPLLAVRILMPSPVEPDTVPVAEKVAVPLPVVRVKLMPDALPETSPSVSEALPPVTWVILTPSPALPVTLPETAMLDPPLTWSSRMP